MQRTKEIWIECMEWELQAFNYRIILNLMFFQVQDLQIIFIKETYLNLKVWKRWFSRSKIRLKCTEKHFINRLNQKVQTNIALMNCQLLIANLISIIINLRVIKEVLPRIIVEALTLINFRLKTKEICYSSITTISRLRILIQELLDKDL